MAKKKEKTPLQQVRNVTRGINAVLTILRCLGVK